MSGGDVSSPSSGRSRCKASNGSPARWYLPHPERETPEVKRLRPNAETEMTAMQVVMGVRS